MRALSILLISISVALVMGQGCPPAAPPPDDNPPVNNPPDNTPPPNNTPPPDNTPPADNTPPISNPPSPFPNGIVFVKANATGANNGSNWTNAYTNLQDAIAAALVSANAVQEIWVAQGTYKPAGPGGNRDAHFLLVNNVTIYGDFSGTEEQLLDRDIAENPTILSGDLNGDDGPNYTNSSDNSRNVIVANNLQATAVLDGFTIEAGNADTTFGGGLSITSGSATIRNCTFIGNQARQGGAVNVDQAAPVFSGCLFRANRAMPSVGGALVSLNSDVQLTTCTFADNRSSSRAGAIWFMGGTGKLTQCVFSENTAGEKGGAIDNGAASLELTSCLFDKNSAPTGGAIYSLEPLNAMNCIFRQNKATVGDGGAIDDTSDTLSLYGCLIDRNQAYSNGGGLAEHGDNPRIQNCTFSGNSADHGGGMYLKDGNCTIANCITWGNSDFNMQSAISQILYSIGDALNFQVPRYCDVQELNDPGIGTIASDPMFVDAANGNLHLKPGSPCINTGNNIDVPAQLTTDLDGNPRIRGTPLKVDMGAYEQ
jgi:predicted outer membrane repeat protein